jgi:uncharacterized protein (TIGR00369 family)
MALTDEEQATWRTRMAEVMVGSRFISSLGITVERWETDGVRLVLPFDERLTNDGREYHGGAIAALLDTAGASAVWAGHDFDRGLRASTVSMTVNYVGRGVGDLVAAAHCVKRGRDLSFAAIEVADRQGTTVATGTLVYRIVA